MLFLYNFSFLQCYHFLIQVFQNFFQKALFREKSYGPLLQNISKKLLLKPPKTFFLVFLHFIINFWVSCVSFKLWPYGTPVVPFYSFFCRFLAPLLLMAAKEIILLSLGKSVLNITENLYFPANIPYIFLPFKPKRSSSRFVSTITQYLFSLQYHFTTY